MAQSSLRPHFEDVQAHYDLSDDFFRLWLDPTQTYSCAYFERDDMTLGRGPARQDRPGAGQARARARDDAARRRLRLGFDDDAGHRALRRQRRRADAEREPKGPCRKVFATSDSPRSKRVLLQGWEQFDEPVDRIVSIGAFEHFGFDRYDDFFKMAYAALPDDGVMLLHTITALTLPQMADRKIPLTFEVARFVKFILTEIFPGGRLPSIEKVEEYATPAGFNADPQPVAAAALRAHAGHLGRGAGGPQGRGHRRAVRRGLRPLHALPHRLRPRFPRRLHRRPPVHAGQVDR